jgi:hypothetical protein
MCYDCKMAIVAGPAVPRAAEPAGSVLTGENVMAWLVMTGGPPVLLLVRAFHCFGVFGLHGCGWRQTETLTSLR